uniref:Rho GTPase-activating protein 32 n=1 Tax=Aceria tosichella TaxID=561515 RepID=A0A6G1SLV2_9ACAR
MNSPHHPHHDHHHDVHQQRLSWFFSFCNQRSSSSSNSSSAGSTHSHGATSRSIRTNRRKTAASRNKFALQYQQQLQQQKRQSSNVFGLDLTEHTQKFSDDDAIPYIVKSCTKFIEKHGIIFGIYRLSGMRVNIHKLRQDFDKDPKISMIDSESISNDAHAVACVLKQYFRELPTPLLTFHMYEKFIELFKQNTIAAIDDELDGDDDIMININNNNNNNNSNDNKDTSQRDNIGQADDQSATNPIKDKDACDNKQSKDQEQSRDQSTSITHQPLRASTARQKFTTSASDSQLISLSSVVTTTASDIRYHVKLEDLKRLLLQLPHAHYQTLKFLMQHLAIIAANGQKTGMDSKNVAIVWAPNLLKPRELELTAGMETLQVIGLQAVITEQLIKHHEFLFNDRASLIGARTIICND